MSAVYYPKNCMCLQVARGEKVWGFETLKSEVLYLCLEDSFARIQSRLFEITDEAPPTLHFQSCFEFFLYFF